MYQGTTSPSLAGSAEDLATAEGQSQQAVPLFRLPWLWPLDLHLHKPIASFDWSSKNTHVFS